MKSIFGLEENVAAALSYVAGPISGIGALVLERENKFVRFHAMQSTLWFTFLLVVGWVINIVTNVPLLGRIVGIFLTPILSIGTVLWVVSAIFLVIKAVSGDKFKLPVIGDVVWSQINK